MRSYLKLLSLVIPLVATQASADSIKMKLTTTIHDSVQVFTNVPSDEAKAKEGWLQASESSSDVGFYIYMKISGQNAVEQNGRLTVTDVPGISDNGRGYSRAKISKVANRIDLVFEELTVKDEEVKPSQIEIWEAERKGIKLESKMVEKKTLSSHRIPLELVRGTFDDYEAGKTVDFRFTKQGIKDYLESSKNQAKAGMSMSGGSVSISADIKRIKPEGKKDSDFGLVSASKTRVEIIWVPYEVKVDGKVSY